MMSRDRKLQGNFERWLRYERAGEHGRAERALGVLLTGLPPVAVSAGFASRVLSSSGLRFAARRVSGAPVQAPGWVWRTAFGVWLVSSFLVAIGATGFAVDLARSGQALELATRLVVALSQFGADVVIVVTGLLRAGSAMSTAFSSPAFLVLALVCAVASLTAVGALKPLLTSERSRHVESY